MKKALLILMSLLMALCLIFVSCDETESSSTESESASEKETESGSESQTVTITFDSKCEATIEAQTLKKGSNIVKPQDPTRNGYTFKGWYFNDNEWLFDNYGAINSICLEAKWEAIEYTITYVGDITGKKTTYTIEDEFELEVSSMPEYYELLGWYEDEANTKSISKIEKGTTGNKTIYVATKAKDIFTYVLKNDGTYSVAGFLSERDPVIVIPSTHNGKPVTSIEPYAFSSCYSLTSVTIGNSVTSIGEEAFSYCDKLTSVTIGNSVTSIGSNAFYDCTKLKCNEYEGGYYLGNDTNEYLAFVKIIDKTATECKINDNTKFILSDAFEDCTSLETITIPDSVTSIGASAFNGCYSLKSITIPNGVTSLENNLFALCDSLESIVIPYGVTSIGSGAFSDCIDLTSITIPNSVTSIGSSAFTGCTKLASITIPNSVTSIGSNAFYGCTNLKYNEHEGSYYLGNDTNKYLAFVKIIDETATECKINDNTKFILSKAFYCCTSLKSITIPNSVTEIGSNAFDGCYLESVNISDIASWCNISFESYLLGEDLYTYSNPLVCARKIYLNGTLVTDLVIPSTVTEIKPFAFYYCTSLKSITIPNSVTSIGEKAFYGCYSLESVTIPDSVTSIGKKAFDDCDSLKYNEYEGCYYLGNEANKYLVLVKMADINASECKINDNAKFILDYAFRYCSAIRTITIPSGVTSIGAYAFYNCSLLRSVTIPNSVTTIGEDAFDGCTKLTSIIIPDSVTSIGKKAFYDCDSLTTINCEAEAQPSGWSYAWKSNCSATVKWGYTEE